MDFSLEDLTITAKSYAEKTVSSINHWRFGNAKQLAFLEDLYVLVNDGIPANRAVEMMSQITKGLNRQVANSLAQKIAEGQPLADGMKEWFSPNVVEIIRVGEAGGALGQTIKSSINTLLQRGAAIGSLIAAVSYPTLVIVIASCVIIYLDNSVFSQFRLIKPESEWPVAGQRLVALANVIQSWWWIVILLLIAFVFIMAKVMSNYVGELRPMMDKIPPFTFFRQLTAARLLETLGLLVSNGVVFKSALKVMQYQANPYLNMHLVMMEHLLSMGKTNIADVLATGLVSQDDLMRLRVMAEVKGFEHGLVRMGVRGAEEATATLKTIAKILGGLMLVTGGVMILIIIQGIYLTGMAMGT